VANGCGVYFLLFGAADGALFLKKKPRRRRQGDGCQDKQPTR
jgi:hypothetical protein